MKILSNILKSSLVIALLVTGACAKFTDFGDLNVSPNNPSTPNSGSLLTNAMIWVGKVTTEVTPCLYTQQFGDVIYIEESRYKTINFDYDYLFAGSPFTKPTTGPLNSLNTVIKLNTDATTKVAAATNGSKAEPRSRLDRVRSNRESLKFRPPIKASVAPVLISVVTAAYCR